MYAEEMRMRPEGDVRRLWRGSRLRMIIGVSIGCQDGLRTCAKMFTDEEYDLRYAKKLDPFGY